MPAVAVLLLALSVPQTRALAVEIVAHRGDEANCPENTLAAFESALSHADRIEFDVRVSSDGHLVVIHDATVDRTTDGSGSVAGKTLVQLQALDADSWFGPAPSCGAASVSNERIPTLAEALAVIHDDVRGTGYSRTALVEHKAGTAVQYAAAFPMDSGSYVRLMSTNAGFIEAFSLLRPDIEVGALGGVGLTCPATPFEASACMNTERLEEIAGDFPSAVFIGWDIRDLDPQDAPLVRAAGYPLYGWTVHMSVPQQVQDAAEFDLDGIVTDDPGAAAADGRFDNLSPQTAFLTEDYTILRITNDPDLIAYDTTADFIANAGTSPEGQGKVNYGNTPASYEHDGWFSWNGAIYRTTNVDEDLIEYANLAGFLTNRGEILLPPVADVADDEWFVYGGRIYRVTSPTGAIIAYDTVEEVSDGPGEILGVVANYAHDGWFSVEPYIYRIGNSAGDIIVYTNLDDFLVNNGSVIGTHGTYADDGWFVVPEPGEYLALSVGIGTLVTLARRRRARASRAL